MSASESAEITANLAHVRDAIAEAAQAAGRDPAEIDLVAVSKTHPAERIQPAIAAGQRRFGENRVQEAEAKWPDLKAAHADLRLHLIGPLQSNKVRQAVQLFDVIETVDRDSIAEKLRAEIDRAGRAPACYVEVNTGEEPQKAGILPDAADAFIERCRETYKLPITGLMCVPPQGGPPAPHFALLRAIAERQGLAILSMGMSQDFAVAIRQGATAVRIGTAIFGARPAPRP
jgi:pyridoxal phosphate enzyme (YggS family)